MKNVDFKIFCGIILTFILFVSGCSKTYTVSFDSDGGTIVQQVNVKKNDKIAEPLEPTKEGYNFVEWQLNGKKYDFSLPVTNDMELLAIWTKVINEITISFDTNGGNVVQNEKIEIGEIPTRPADPVKEGYEFVEWQLNGQKYEFDKEITINIVLEAIWKEKEHVVTFDTDGGSYVKKQTIYEGKKITKPTNPTKKGYIFVEWQLDGEEFDFKTINITQDITLKALWRKAEKYEINFDTNGGSNVKKQTIYEGEKVTKPTNPTKKGYIFVEWQLDGEEFNFKTKKITQDITLKAIWRVAQEYKITFDTDGGSVVNELTIYEGEKVTQPTNPAKNGYTFKEWQLDGKKYDFNVKVTKDINLKAIWVRKSAKYTIVLEKVDQYSPDVKLIITDNNNNLISGSFVLRYLDGVKICSSTNLKTAISNLNGESELIIEFSNGNIEYAKIK